MGSSTTLLKKIYLGRKISQAALRIIQIVKNTLPFRESLYLMYVPPIYKFELATVFELRSETYQICLTVHFASENVECVAWNPNERKLF